MCGRSAEDIFCRDCYPSLKKCARKNSQQFISQEKLPLLIWGNYGGKLKRVIALLKYENHPELAQPLGQWLGSAWLKSSQFRKNNQALVVPIPLHPKKMEQRGFNQAELIAKSFCRFTGLKCQPQGLARVKETAAMFNLNLSQRQENLTDAFRLGKNFRRRLPSRPILLLDDIYTTGTTVKAAAHILQRQGVQVAGVLAVATPTKRIAKDFIKKKTKG